MLYVDGMKGSTVVYLGSPFKPVILYASDDASAAIQWAIDHAFPDDAFLFDAQALKANWSKRK